MIEEIDLNITIPETRIAGVGIGAKPALLGAARRYETRHCPIFSECPLPHCEGGVWCEINNLGGSHGRIGGLH